MFKDGYESEWRAMKQSSLVRNARICAFRLYLEYDKPTLLKLDIDYTTMKYTAVSAV